ncbi:penicillin-binding protein 2 [Myxococcota bacterium]|nr:penicillin-binding protein 2 [Myxococcota bacterium]
MPILAVAVFVVFGIFVARLFQLQIIESADLRQRSQRNSVRTEILEAPRGDIFDRSGRLLATTRPAFGVKVLPVDLSEREMTLSAVGELLDANPVELDERVGKPVGRQRFQAVYLEDDAPYDRLARVESHLYALPGVMTDIRPRRDYVGGERAAHLLGLIGEIDADELAKPDFAGYRRGEVIGKAGVETLMEPHLRGHAGGRNVVVDVAGRSIEVIDEVLPLPGGSVTLTIDLDLQEVAEEAFLPDVLGEPARMGAVVALDPRNGDVLAMVSKPSFDPNDFAGGVDDETWERLTGDRWRPIQNRAISGQYAPGSTYKAIVGAAALETGVIDETEKIYCPGSFTLGRRTYRCWKREGHGDVDMHDALKKSCDVYFYQVGLRLGIDRIAEFAAGFNLGRRTGIPLHNEQPGLNPTSAWKERRFAEVWMKGETVSASIGQSFNLVTPMQLAVAFGALATGRVVVPRILLHTTEMDGRLRAGPDPRFTGHIPVSPENLAIIRAGLEAVVQETGGTGGRARVPGVRVVGKTGTSQVVGLEHTDGLEDDEVAIQHRDHAWFASYAPAEDPEIVVVALVEHGGGGGSTAAPVAQKVLARYFEKRSLEESENPNSSPDIRQVEGSGDEAWEEAVDEEPSFELRARPPWLERLPEVSFAGD